MSPTVPRPTPAQRRFERGLRTLKALQASGRRVYQSHELPRRERETLVAQKYLMPVIKGWYMASSPFDAPGDSTVWYASVRDFIGGYCDQRFGDAWHLSPHHSLLVRSGATTAPAQWLVYAEEGTRQPLGLPAGCSVFIAGPLKDVDTAHVERVGPLRIMTLATALVHVSDAFFEASPVDAHLALAQLTDAADLNRLLLRGHPVIAGRLAGALRAVHRPALADDVVATMRAVGHSVTETQPFRTPRPTLGHRFAPSPYVQRLRLMWADMRAHIDQAFATAPGLPADPASYLDAVKDVYTTDAYHSAGMGD